MVPNSLISGRNERAAGGHNCATAITSFGPKCLLVCCANPFVHRRWEKHHVPPNLDRRRRIGGNASPRKYSCIGAGPVEVPGLEGGVVTVSRPRCWRPAFIRPDQVLGTRTAGPADARISKGPG